MNCPTIEKYQKLDLNLDGIVTIEEISTSHFYKTSDMLKFLDTIRLDIIDIVLNT